MGMKVERVAELFAGAYHELHAQIRQKPGSEVEVDIAIMTPEAGSTGPWTHGYNLSLCAVPVTKLADGKVVVDVGHKIEVEG